MSADKQMTSVSDSRMARIAYNFFKEELDKEQIVILNKLKQMARDSKHDITEYAGGLIAMNSLESLEKRLLKQINLEDETMKKDMNNGI